MNVLLVLSLLANVAGIGVWAWAVRKAKRLKRAAVSINSTSAKRDMAALIDIVQHHRELSDKSGRKTTCECGTDTTGVSLPGIKPATNRTITHWLLLAVKAGREDLL